MENVFIIGGANVYKQALQLDLIDYIYANEWQKKELVGAKETSYVPIWLTKDQLHIAHNHLASVLEHELVHVVAKDFGNLLFNGSWNIALIEGLAEAVTQGASQHSTLNELVAAQPEFPPIEKQCKLSKRDPNQSAASLVIPYSDPLESP